MENKDNSFTSTPTATKRCAGTPSQAKGTYIRTFGRTHGKKLSARQQHLVDNLLPLLVPSPQSPVPQNSTAILEIGFGAGEHLRELAAQNPDTMVIGAEPFINGVASLLSAITGNGDWGLGTCKSINDPQSLIKPEYRNIRIWPDDVRKLLTPYLQNPNLLFAQIWILHPDPWPKARHEKRRLLSAGFLTFLSKHLAKDGRIIIGTDHHEYFDWILEQVKRTPLTSSIIHHPSSIIKTRYQEKNKAGTIAPKYLTLSV